MTTGSILVIGVLVILVFWMADKLTGQRVEIAYLRNLLEDRNARERAEQAKTATFADDSFDVELLDEWRSSV